MISLIIKILSNKIFHHNINKIKMRVNQCLIKNINQIVIMNKKKYKKKMKYIMIIKMLNNNNNNKFFY